MLKKSSLLLFLLCSFNTSAFELGEEVIETHRRPSVGVITKISDNGKKYQLDNDLWYDDFVLAPLLGEMEGVHVGESVYEVASNDTGFRRVVAIYKGNFHFQDRDGRFLLDDGRWYKRDKLLVEVDELKGIREGDQVSETYMFDSDQRVIAVLEKSSGVRRFLLSDGELYRSNYVHKAD